MEENIQVILKKIGNEDCVLFDGSSKAFDTKEIRLKALRKARTQSFLSKSEKKL